MGCNLALVWFDWDRVLGLSPQVSVALGLFIAIIASAHVILNKSDTRSATGWVGLIWLVPVVGSVLYLLLGINRIERRAKLLRSGPTPSTSDRPGPTPADLDGEFGVKQTHLLELARVGADVTSKPLEGGNRVEILVDGDQAYPAMLEAIGAAKSSISLMSYIFEAKGIGEAFIRALVDAQARGVEVRVLVDDVGTRYGSPRIDRVLRREKIKVAKFLPALLPRGLTHFNLRNHRKIMVVDGRLGFTGGMNIRQGCVIASRPSRPTKDLHFRIEGPLVAQLQGAFVEDWVFTTGEHLGGETWFPKLEPAGTTLARGITDGPDIDIGNLHWMFLAAIVTARRSIRVMTPYFLPDTVLVKALQVAAMRGIEVDIVVPEVGNLPVVRWAMWAHYPDVLQRGVRIWLTPPPFDHSKILVIDGAWASVGSGNWDTRSLRLNFEFNVECYDEQLATALEMHVRSRMMQARVLHADELRRRPVLFRLRDGIARLWSPYL